MIAEGEIFAGVPRQASASVSASAASATLARDAVASLVLRAVGTPFLLDGSALVWAGMVSTAWLLPCCSVSYHKCAAYV